MDGVYEVSSLDRVLNLESDLDKSLQDLQDEIDNGNFIGKAASPQGISSILLPKDSRYFRNERKIAIRNSLKVREARFLQNQADLMKEELDSCMHLEYTASSIPLILHQHFVNRVEELLLCKHLHMLRWARFCEHTKEMEALYPEYHKCISEITRECHDAKQRAERLSKSREALLMNEDIPKSIVKHEDLVIYTRWLVCHFQSVKKIHAFMKVIQWIPQSQLQIVNIQTSEETKQMKNAILDQFKNADNPTSTIHPSSSLNVRSVPTIDQSSSLNIRCSFDMASSMVKEHSSQLWKCTVRKKLTQRQPPSDMPLLSTKLKDFAELLDTLLDTFSIDMRSSGINDPSDEMEMFNLALRKFKQVHYLQNQLRKFVTYECIKDNNGCTIKENELTTYKKESKWLKYIRIKSSINAARDLSYTKLEEQNYRDEILVLQSRFLHVESSERVLYFLREHMKHTENFVKIQPSFVTSYANGKNTKDVWNNIFNHNVSRKEVPKETLEFDAKILDDDLSQLDSSECDIQEAVQKLGLESDDIKRHPITNNGAYLSLLVLRHLKIKEHQQMCLDMLNYFRSVERTLTINDVGLLMKSEPCRDSFLLPEECKGLGSHQYLHNSPVNYVMNNGERDVTNFDDFYMFKDDRILVQDQKGYFIMYDAALTDFKALERELLLVSSHFIQQYGIEQRSDITMIDFDEHSSRKVDRLCVLLDIWRNEMLFCQKKRHLLDCYFEVYHHTTNEKERRCLAEIMMTIIKQRPRIDYRDVYFVKVYQYETVLLRAHCDLVKSIIDEHIVDQREYVQKIYRDGKQRFGFPLKILPFQSVSVNTSRPALKNVFMLEFHPSLAMISSLPAVLHQSYRQLLHMHQPKTVMKKVILELKLVRTVQRCWNDKQSFGSTYSKEICRDFFSGVFIEEPTLVCEVGESMTQVKDMRGSRNLKEEKMGKIISSWSKVLEVITYRHRLLTALNETDILYNVYKDYGRKIGVDECHGYLRPVSFDFAQTKSDENDRPLTLKQLLEDESKVDRFIPGQSSMGIAELDEKHLAVFNFRNREGLLNILQSKNVDKLRLTLMVQVVQKNLLASVVQQMNSCMNLLRDEHKDMFTNGTSYDTIIKPSLADVVKQSSLLALPGALAEKPDAFKYLRSSFISLQAEKTFYRNKMLNDFIRINEKKQIQTTEETVRVKKYLVEAFCLNLHTRLSQHAVRAQILAYLYSMTQLLGQFPVTRDAHFMLGSDDEIEERMNTSELPDPSVLQRRPRKLLSNDGNVLLNLWYLPHHTEVLHMYEKCEAEECSKKLTLVLRLLSAVHDICQYLCAHARSGSSQARMGSHKLEFCGVTADWGGSEGIGAELREIQKQINKLSTPADPQQVAYFLERKRDVMYLKFEITINYSARESFLSAGNEHAQKRLIDGMHAAVKDLSNAERRSYASFNLEIPEPLQVDEDKTQKLFPWRSFINRHTTFPGLYEHFYDMAFQMQFPLFGLSTVDRHVVHGEILGVSLLLEDVLTAGLTKFNLPDKDTPRSTSHSRPLSSLKVERCKPRCSFMVPNKMANSIQSGLSFETTPLEAVEFMHAFLLLWLRLESVKYKWGCQRLNTLSIDTQKSYSSFVHLFKTEVVHLVYKQISSVYGSEFDLIESPVDANEVVQLPGHVTEYEIKSRELSRLLEIIECNMINECIRKISRKHTLVLAERVREDQTLPTDLWKKASMEETFTLSKPHIVEEFLEQLNIVGNVDAVTFDVTHLNKCLKTLATACMNREKSLFLSYASFYENLLRQQNQALYLKEQEVKQLNSILESNRDVTSIEIDCGMADQSYILLLEVTALRTKIKELTALIEDGENVLMTRLKEEYKQLVEELFHNAFIMKSRFDQFQSSLYADVHQTLTQVRRIAVEKIKNVRVKVGFETVVDMTSKRLIMAEALREKNRENEELSTAISKLRALNTWNRVKNKCKCREKLVKYQRAAAKATKLSLENNLIFEEKEILMNQEQVAIRKLLVSLEKECDSVRTRLQKEERMQSRKSHAQLQEAYSTRHLEIAKASNLEKLVADLEEKERELIALRNSTGVDRRFSMRSATELKRLLKETTQQMNHERNMKLDAFERVDELQNQVRNLEMEVVNLLSKQKESYHETCFPLVPGGRVSPQKLRLSTQTAHTLALDVRPDSTAEISRPRSSRPSRNDVHSQPNGVKRNMPDFSLHNIRKCAFP